MLALGGATCWNLACRGSRLGSGTATAPVILGPGPHPAVLWCLAHPVVPGSLCWGSPDGRAQPESWGICSFQGSLRAAGNGAAGCVSRWSCFPRSVLPLVLPLHHPRDGKGETPWLCQHLLEPSGCGSRGCCPLDAICFVINRARNNFWLLLALLICRPQECSGLER